MAGDRIAGDAANNSADYGPTEAVVTQAMPAFAQPFVAVLHRRGWRLGLGMPRVSDHGGCLPSAIPRPEWAAPVRQHGRAMGGLAIVSLRGGGAQRAQNGKGKHGMVAHQMVPLWAAARLAH
jgi:hypothetical protein